jgi:large repetitive protein
VHAAACVVPGGLLRAAAPPGLRGHTPVDAALVSGAEAVRGTGIVRTDLPADTRCVVLVLDVPAGSAPPADGLLLGLDGAEQPVAAAAVPLPPLAVTTGSRAVLLFDVRPTGAARVTVTVARDRGWSVAGVLSAPRTAASVAGQLRQRGIDGLVAGLTERSSRSSTLRWIGATP